MLNYIIRYISIILELNYRETYHDQVKLNNFMNEFLIGNIKDKKEQKNE